MFFLCPNFSSVVHSFIFALLINTLRFSLTLRVLAKSSESHSLLSSFYESAFSPTQLRINCSTYCTSSGFKIKEELLLMNDESLKNLNEISWSDRIIQAARQQVCLFPTSNTTRLISHILVYITHVCMYKRVLVTGWKKRRFISSFFCFNKWWWPLISTNARKGGFPPTALKASVLAIKAYVFV